MTCAAVDVSKLCSACTGVLNEEVILEPLHQQSCAATQEGARSIITPQPGLND